MFIGKHEIAGKACIMGILNVTPDSFSDGGDFDTIEDALAQVERMISQGASIIDVGGESTRPGAEFVTEEEEIARIVPIIQAIKEKYDVLISIDTYKTATARAALEAGADILNDVWAGLYDGQMLALSAEKNVPIILMHNQKEEKYNDVTENVCTFLSQRTQAALEAGVAKENIWIDPGFGFAKNVQHNIDLLRGLDKVVGLGYPVLFGISRKRVVDFLLGGNIPAKDRDQGQLLYLLMLLAKDVRLSVSIMLKPIVMSLRLSQEFYEIKKSSNRAFFLVLNCPNADRFFRDWEVSPPVFVNCYSIRAVSKNIIESLSSPITSNFHRFVVGSIIRNGYG